MDEDHRSMFPCCGDRAVETADVEYRREDGFSRINPTPVSWHTLYGQLPGQIFSSWTVGAVSLAV